MYGICNYVRFEKFPHILSRKLGVIKINPVYEPFKNVSSLDWTSNSIEDTIQALSDSKELEINIAKYYFRAKNLEEIEKNYKSIFLLEIISNTAKAFVVTPKMIKKFHNFQREGYDKGYKIFIADENLFVCILIYFNKNIHFQWITKKLRITK